MDVKVKNGKTVIKLEKTELRQLEAAKDTCDGLAKQDIPADLRPGIAGELLGKIIDHFTDDKPDAGEKPEPPPSQETRDGSPMPKTPKNHSK